MRDSLNPIKEQIHPFSVFAEYSKMFVYNPKSQNLGLKDLFVKIPIRTAGNIYGEGVGTDKNMKSYGNYLLRKAKLSPASSDQETAKLSLLKVLNPLNIVLTLVRTTRAIVVQSAQKIPFSSVRNAIIGIVCTPLFLVESVLDLFNKTPSQLYKRWQEKKQLQRIIKQGYGYDSLIEMKPLLDSAKNLSTPKAQKAIIIDLSEVKDQLAELAQECVKQNNLDKIKKILGNIKQNPGYQIFRKEEQYLRDLHSLQLKEKPMPKTNLTDEQTRALSLVSELDDLLQGAKNKPNARVEDQLKKLRSSSVKQTLQAFQHDDSAFEPSRTEMQSRG